MRLRSLVALATVFVLSFGAAAGWPRHDTNRDGVINFADLSLAVQSGDYQLVNMVLSHWGQDVLSQPTGNPNAPGADAKAIARWNMVPWQTFTGEFNVGVVAFHINGIGAVSFSVNGGAWVEVTEMTLNPESGTYEYWIRVNAADYADGLVEIRAVAFPVNGMARVLAGEMTSATARDGEYAMHLYSNASGGLDAPTVWVCSTSGDDATGQGTESEPYRTIMRAARAIATSNGGLADGGTIYLKRGNHSWGDYSYSLLTSADARWLTVTAAPGLSRSHVRINSVASYNWENGIRVGRQRIFNVSIHHPASISSGHPNAAVWIDNCTIFGPGPVSNGAYSDYKPINESKFSRGVFVTDTQIYDTYRPSRNWHYARNVTLDRIGLDGFFNPSMLVNCQIRNLGVYPTGGHRDAVQFYQSRENTIIFGLRATDNIVAQPLFSRGTAGNRAMNNTALVNMIFHLPDDTTFHRSQWQQEGDHLLIWNSVFLNLPMLFRDDADSSGALPTTLTNVSIAGSVFEKLMYSVSNTPISTYRVSSNHYIDATSFGAIAPGQDVSIGDPRFRSPTLGDLRPALDSPLLRRMPRLVAVDMAQVHRPPVASVGALEP